MSSQLNRRQKRGIIVHSLLSNRVLLSLIICIDMILLDNLLQRLIYIIMIDLSSICDCTTVLIYKLLDIIMSYFCIKIKLKILLFPTYPNPVPASSCMGRWGARQRTMWNLVRLRTIF
jgi:hypothetical protein